MRFGGHGPGALGRRQGGRSRPPGGNHWRSDPAAEARPARPNRSVLGGSAAGASGGAPGRRQPSCGVALAAALRRCRSGRSVARQDPAAGETASADRTVAKVLALTCGEPPGEATHWTGRAMAKGVGLSLRTVQRIWQAHHLQPHRIRTFKRSNDPAFAEKDEDIVGLYMHPPAHAVVLSIDEKSQIQALDRTQPGLPIKPGRCGTMTHDYKRHGTTTRLAALNTLDGVVLGRCMQRHTHQEFIRFLNAVERAVPAGKLVHAVLDNYGTHKHPKVKAWLARHPRWTFHFTPKSGSWLNAVEGFFSKLTRKRLRRGVFRSIVDLQAAINRYLNEHNCDPKPFV